MAIREEPDPVETDILARFTNMDGGEYVITVHDGGFFGYKEKTVQRIFGSNEALHPTGENRP